MKFNLKLSISIHQFLFVNIFGYILFNLLLVNFIFATIILTAPLARAGSARSLSKINISVGGSVCAYSLRKSVILAPAFSDPFLRVITRSRGQISRMATSFASCDACEETEAALPRKGKGFIDIGANLLDPMYTGLYFGGTKKRHEPDLDLVLKRSFCANPPVIAEKDGPDVKIDHSILESLFITAGTIDEGVESLALARKLNSEFPRAGVVGDSVPLKRFYSTIGIHPTRCAQELGIKSTDDEESIPLSALDTLKKKILDVANDGRTDNVIIAIGECGLDYEREQFCHRAVQRAGFLVHLDVAEQTCLPLFLHNRNTGRDLYDILKENCEKLKSGGVVHSFDDTFELAKDFIDLGLYIGLNGCSLRTQENLNVIRRLPLDRILIETDCPWCEVKPSHAGFEHVKTKFETRKDKKFEPGCCVKGRNEPCHIIHVAEIIAGVRGISITELTDACYENTIRLFGQSMNTL